METDKMIEKITDDFFSIKIPLPDTPLKNLNSVVIKGGNRNLIIDTGLNHDQCYNAMMAGLKELNVDLKKTDFLITHLHADHFGLLSRLATSESHVYFNRPEAELIESWQGWDEMLNFAGNNGFPKEKLKKALESHPGFKHASKWIPSMEMLQDNDQINIGRYSLGCIETPGHTPGHICLFEPENKIFIAGDHILGDITPNIQCWAEEQNMLKDYFQSLDKVYDLNVDTVIPGHRSIFTDFRKRIDELKSHHRQRLEEVKEIISKKPLNGFETASHMTWAIKADSWDDFPIAQQWFAAGEAIAHLQYLEKENQIEKIDTNGIFNWQCHHQ